MKDNEYAGEAVYSKLMGKGNAPATRRSANVLQLQPMGDKVPPHSAEAEMATLGAIMLDRIALSKVIEIVEPDCFYREAHRKIYEAMLFMSERSITIDLVSLSEELRRLGTLENIGGSFYLSEINRSTPTASNVEHYARIVQEHYLKRQLISASGRIMERAYDPATDALEEIDEAEKMIFDIAEKRLRKTYVGMDKLAKETFDLIASMASGTKDGLTGVPTGYMRLDEMLGGFRKSDLVIIAARPSMGKTALALSIARNAAVESNVPVAFFSIEMAAIQLTVRLLSAEARVNAHNILTGRISDGEFPELAKKMDKLAKAPIFIDDSASLSIMELRAKCRRLKAERNIGLVMIDYLQLMHGSKAESREREISQISRSLKQLAKELDVPVVALSQLNRSVESRSDKRPMLSDLRESGSIEQDADVVMFINRPEHYEITTYDDGQPTENTAELIIGKQRNGPIGTVRVSYLKDYARFENLIFGREEPPEYGGSIVSGHRNAAGNSSSYKADDFKVSTYNADDYNVPF
jgi:replicative DNA helicase